MLIIDGHDIQGRLLLKAEYDALQSKIDHNQCDINRLQDEIWELEDQQNELEDKIKPDKKRVTDLAWGLGIIVSKDQLPLFDLSQIGKKPC